MGLGLRLRIGRGIHVLSLRCLVRMRLCGRRDVRRRRSLLSRIIGLVGGVSSVSLIRRWGRRMMGRIPRKCSRRRMWVRRLIVRGWGGEGMLRWGWRGIGWVNILDQGMGEERRSRGGQYEDLWPKITSRENLRAENVWRVCLSMSNPNGGVYGSDEPRHGGLDRRLNGEMIVVGASAVVTVADERTPGHRNMVYVSTVIGGAVVDAAVSIEDVVAVAGNELLDERRKGLTPRSNLGDSSRLWGADNWTKETQKKQVYLPRELEVPEQMRGRRKQENGRKNSDL